MSRSTVSTFQLMEKWPNEEAARIYLEKRLWPKGPVCPRCWAVMKRGLHGVYHHASKKHLNRYVNEFTFRLNDGNVERHTFDRLNSLVDNVVGKRITYQNLIAERN
jgi:hypothetical protein